MHNSMYNSILLISSKFSTLLYKFPALSWRLLSRWYSANAVLDYSIRVILLNVLLGCINLYLMVFWNLKVWLSGLMIMASHQTFSGQSKHTSGQIKFSQTNFLYIINGNCMEFAKENEFPDNFQSLSQALDYTWLFAYKMLAQHWNND